MIIYQAEQQSLKKPVVFRTILLLVYIYNWIVYYNLVLLLYLRAGTVQLNRSHNIKSN